MDRTDASRSVSRRRGGAFALAGALLVASLCGSSWAATPDQPRVGPPPANPQSELTVDALSVVRVRSKAVADARSNRTLGPAREGSGVVLDAQGLVLTIGYLILEAETVELSTVDGRSFPATVVGYDSATGDQYLVLWPPGRETVRRSTSPTSVGDPEDVHDLLDRTR